MGIYINPPNHQSKEDFLMAKGTVVEVEEMQLLITDPDDVGVCLVNNGMFTAAVVAHDQREVADFTSPKDDRDKMYFKVPRTDLRALGLNV
jgi:hypothetical protein